MKKNKVIDILKEKYPNTRRLHTFVLYLLMDKKVSLERISRIYGTTTYDSNKHLKDLEKEIFHISEGK